MVMSIGSTIAYFSVSTDPSVLFVKGEVELEQVIVQRDESFKIAAVDDDADYESYLLPSELYPAGVVKFWNQRSYARDQIVSVKNMGSSPMFVRTVFAYPCDAELEFNVVEMISDERVWDWNWHEDPIEIDGTCYNVVSASYIYRDGVVLPGESTYPSLLQVRVHDGSQSEVALYSISQGVSIDDEDALTVLNERLGHDYEKLFNR